MKAVAVFLLVLSCSHPRPSVEERPGGPRLAIERSACKGSCPVYRVDVDEEGHVVYEGTEHVAVVGRREEQLPPERVATIAQRLVDAGMLTVDAPSVDQCDRPTETCHPTITVELLYQGRYRRLRVDRGNPCVEPTFFALADRVDRELQTERWVEPKR